jgi:hypothetical protein
MSAEVAQHAFGQSLAERRQHRVPRALLERDVVDAGSGAGALPLALQAGDAPAALAVAGGRVDEERLLARLRVRVAPGEPLAQLRIPDLLQARCAVLRVRDARVEPSALDGLVDA